MIICIKPVYCENLEAQGNPGKSKSPVNLFDMPWSNKHIMAKISIFKFSLKQRLPKKVYSGTSVMFKKKIILTLTMKFSTLISPLLSLNLCQ